MQELELKKGIKKVLTGNHAVSYGALLSKVQVISAYPITPQTQIVELLSEFVADGRLNAKFITVESEHSAMAACVGASATGARAFTATSSQGLLLMHEMLHWASGARLPIVMANINRAVAPPWSIWGDQNDSLSQRDTGWMQVYCESNQEVLDNIILGYKVAEKVKLPIMLVLDAFVLSHTAEPVEIYHQEMVDSFLPPYEPEGILNPKSPIAYGSLSAPDTYMEFRYHIQKAMDRAREVFKKESIEFKDTFSRFYSPVEEFMMEDADYVIVTSGSITSTARYSIKKMRKEANKNIGILKMRHLRPFPFEEIRIALSGRKKVAVVDRNISFGYHGIFYEEIKSALYGENNSPLLYGYIVGLGGRDVTPRIIETIVEDLEKRETSPQDIVWIDIKE